MPGAEYAAGGEVRLASYQCHVHRAHVRSPNAGALHWDPFCFDPAQHLGGRCAGKGSPQFDPGERLGSDDRNFHLRVGRTRAQRLGIPCLWMPSDRQFRMLAEPAVAGDRLSQLYRNMRSNIDMEVRRIGSALG
jgi:hypothetical protein